MASTTYASTKEVREDLIRDRSIEGYTLIDAKTYGPKTWVAYIDPKGVKHIELILIQNVGEGEVAYKVIPESAGPAYYYCPLEFLEIVPVASTEFAREWRAKVKSRAEHKKRARAVLAKHGVKIEVFGNTYTTMGYALGRSWIVKREDGQLARLTPRSIEHVRLA